MQLSLELNSNKESVSAGYLSLCKHSLKARRLSSFAELFVLKLIASTFCDGFFGAVIHQLRQTQQRQTEVVLLVTQVDKSVFLHLTVTAQSSTLI